MSLDAMVQEDLETWFALTTESRPSCWALDCSCEGIWNLFYENTCPNHPANPAPYCDSHKILVESRIPLSAKRGFQCSHCASKGQYFLLGHLLKIERIYN